MKPRWFPRFGAIPGVEYATPPDVDVAKLRRRGERPKIERYSGLPPSLMWGDTSESPASAHLLDEQRGVSTTRLLKNLAEALELPGTPSDYHYALQGVAGALRSHRREGPHVFAEMERLYWLDIRLVQTCPDAVSDEDIRPGEYYHVMAFHALTEMYLTEGLLADAARVADIAARFGQAAGQAIETARARFEALTAEDPQK